MLRRRKIAVEGKGICNDLRLRKRGGDEGRRRVTVGSGNPEMALG